MTLPLQVPIDFSVIAHRGVSAYAPENSLPAFALAKKMGVREVELDVQLASDGIVVVCHDETLERYGHGKQLVENLESDILLALDMGSWFSPYFFKDVKLLTLKRLFAEFAKDFIFHIELKGKAEALAAAVYALVRDMGYLEQVVFTSFSYAQLERMRRCEDSCRLGWLVQDFNKDVLLQARQLKLYQLCPKAGNTNKVMVCQGRGVAKNIRAWGLGGTPQQIRALIHQVVEAGCNGMTLNWPDWVEARAQ